MYTCIKTLVALIAFMACGKAQGTDLKKWLGNVSISASHGLNYHLDGNQTIYWNPYQGYYMANNSASFELSYHISQKLIVSSFYEHFQGLYTDYSRYPRRDLILFRWGHHAGLLVTSPQKITHRWSISPRLGVLGRKGYEQYEYYVMTHQIYRTVELLDVGISSGLSVDYYLGKGFSILALADYTRFIVLKSSETGELDFYDGPTLNYVRTRLGIRYSFSHLIKDVTT